MTIEDLIEWRQIEFPEDLSLKQIEFYLFPYIVTNLPHVKISYLLKLQKRVVEAESGIALTTTEGSHIAGTITTESREVIGFNLVPNRSYDNKFNGITFDTIPGYDVEEHRPSYVSGVNSIKEKIKEYFVHLEANQESQSIDKK